MSGQLPRNVRALAIAAGFAARNRGSTPPSDDNRP
jgi:hypothetical protein